MRVFFFAILTIAAPVAASPLELYLGAGGQILASTNSETAVDPFVSIDVRTKLADTTYSPRLKIYAELGALPTETISFDSPDSIRSVEAVLRISQPLSEILYFRPYVEVGFSTKLPGETEVLNRTARFWSTGFEIGDAFNALSVGFGTDQRLDGDWSPVTSVTGKVRLKSIDKANFYMVAKGIFDMHLYQTDRRDVIMIGFSVGN